MTCCWPQGDCPRHSHHEPLRTMIDQPSLSFLNYCCQWFSPGNGPVGHWCCEALIAMICHDSKTFIRQSWSIITNHYQVLPTIANHHSPLMIVTCCYPWFTMVDHPSATYRGQVLQVLALQIGRKAAQSVHVQRHARQVVCQLVASGCCRALQCYPLAQPLKHGQFKRAKKIWVDHDLSWFILDIANDGPCLKMIHFGLLWT